MEFMNSPSNSIPSAPRYKPSLVLRLIRLDIVKLLSMKNKLAFALLLFSTSQLAAVGELTKTSRLAVEEIRIQHYQGDAFYYFTPAGNDWNASGCPET